MQNNLSLDKDPEDSPLGQELMQFYHEMTDYHGHCAFLLDAVTSMLLARAEVDNLTLEGLHSLSWAMRHKAGELAETYKHLHERIRRKEASYEKFH